MNKLVLSWNDIEEQTQVLCAKIKKDLPDYKNLELVCISRGGLFIGGIVAYALGIKNIHCVALESYEEDKDGSNGRIRSRTPFMKAIWEWEQDEKEFDDYEQVDYEYKDRTFLFIDDVNDTSQTYQFIKDKCALLELNYYFATTYHKNRQGSNLLPDFYAQEVESEAWIVFPWDKYGERT